EGDRPVPHYWDHVMWVWGYQNMDEFMRFIPKVSLTGHLNRITVPFLITHGANDRQIPFQYAQQCYDEAVNSLDRGSLPTERLLTPLVIIGLFCVNLWRLRQYL